MEGITSDANLTSPDANTWFSQYKDWAPAGGSTDFFAAANWSGGIPTTLYPNSGGSTAANWNTGPAANWIASMNNAGGTPEAVTVGANATVLALELASASSEMILTVDSEVDFEIHNGGRLRAGGHLALNGATLRTQRDLEILAGATVSGAGIITGNQQWLTGIAEFTGLGLLEPHVVNEGTVAPDKDIGAAPPPPPPPGNPTDFTLFENFDGLSNGTLNGRNGWSAPSLATVVANPEDGGKAMQVNGTGSLGVAYKALGALSIANDATGTLFMRVKPSASVEHALGLSDKASPSTWSDYEAQINWKNGGTVAARNAGSETTVAAFTAGEWQNLWVVVDNTDDTYAVYVSDSSDSGPADGSNLIFRNTSAGALTTFLAMVATAAESELLLDDIYLDPTHENRQVPDGLTLPDPGGDSDLFGAFTIEGAYTQKPGGVLAIDFAGIDNSNASELQYDSIAVTGAASLAGLLEITLTDGFIPQAGDTFTVLTAGLISGTFDHADDTVVSKDGSTTFSIQYTATSVTIEALASLSPAEAWRDFWFNQTDNTGDAADTFDFDMDGMSNLLERAFGSNPTVSDLDPVASIPPAESIVNDTGMDYLAITYRRLVGGTGTTGIDYTANGIIYTLEYDNDLTDPWNSGSVVPVGSPIDNGDGTEMVTVRLTVPITSPEPQFIRLKIAAS